MPDKEDETPESVHERVQRVDHGTSENGMDYVGVPLQKGGFFLLPKSFVRLPTPKRKKEPPHSR